MLKYFKKYLLFLWLDSARQNNQTLASLVGKCENAKVLEIGSHDGSWIIDRVKNIKNPKIYGIDIDEDYIKLSEKKGIKMYKADAEKKLPFKSDYFDLVSANQIIEHLMDVDGFVKETYRILKPNGTLLISTENLSSWHNLAALLLGWQAFSQHISRIKNIGNPMRIAKYENYDSLGMHIKIFTLRGLSELLNLHKYKIENRFGAGYYPFPPPFSRLLSHLDPKHSAFIGVKAKKVKVKL